MQIDETSLIGFSIVPSHNHLLISRDGKVFDCKAERYYEINYTTNYPSINAWGCGTLNIHRLLGLTFLECPGDPDMMEINHINGDKLDFSLDNLEWQTVSGNVTHAYVTGLRPDNKPVLVKDLSTDRIDRYYSLNACARKFNVNGEVVSRYLKNRSPYPFMSHYELIFEGQEWRGLTKDDIGNKRPGLPAGVVALKSETSELYVFESIATAAARIGVSAYRVAARMYGSVKEELNGYTLWPLKGFKESLENSIYVESPKQKPIAPKRKPVPVEVVNTEDQTVSNWKSVEQFGNSVGVGKNTIQKSMYLNDGRWRKYIITYCPGTPK